MAISRKNIIFHNHQLLTVLKEVKFRGDRSVVNLCNKRFAFLTALGANIFVSSDGVLKLGDFGSSIKLKNPLQTVYGEISNVRGTVGEQRTVHAVG